MVGTPSLRLRGDYLAIVTLGFNEIIRVVLQNTKGDGIFGGALGLKGIPPYTTVFWVFSIAAITIYVVSAMVNSTYGRGFLAVRDDEIAAESMGINTVRYKVVAFVTGAFFAGLAGGLYAHFRNTIAPEGFNFLKSVDIVVMVILGGMGSTVGVVLAAIVLTVLNEYLRDFEQYRMIIFSLLLIVMMILRPQGLLPASLFQRRKA
jgi:branched-chain amino acid transport system permease protein